MQFAGMLRRSAWRNRHQAIRTKHRFPLQPRRYYSCNRLCGQSFPSWMRKLSIWFAQSPEKRSSEYRPKLRTGLTHSANIYKTASRAHPLR